MNLDEFKPMPPEKGPPLPIILDPYIPFKGYWPWYKEVIPVTKAMIHINTDPAGAMVSANGQISDVTPLTLTVDPGTYTILLHIDGYQDDTEIITVVAGDNKTINKTLTALPTTAKIHVNTDPAGALVIANGQTIKMIHPCLVGALNIVVQPSNNVKQSAMTEVNTPSVVYVKVATLTFTGSVGAARIKFELRSDNVAGTAMAVIYKNGVPVVTNPAATPPYTEWSNPTNIYVTFTQDVGGLALNDTVEIWAKTVAPGTIAYVRNFTIGYDIVALPAAQTTIDKIYFDSINGVSGTDWPIGTAEMPSNNWTDTQTIVKARNITTIQLVHGKITTTNLSGYHFLGNDYSDPGGSYIDNVIEIGSYLVTNCSFEGININSPGPSAILLSCGPFTRCYHVNVFEINMCCDFSECDTVYAQVSINDSVGFYKCNQILTTTISNCFHFVDCASVVSANMNAYDLINCSNIRPSASFAGYGVLNCIMKTPLIDFTAIPGGDIYTLNFKGRPTTIAGITVAMTIEISGDFELTVDSSCTAGIINAHGNIKLIDNHTGTCVVNDYTNKPRAEVAINTTAILASEKNVLLLETADFHYTVDKLRLKFDSPGFGNDIIVRLYELINGAYPGGGPVDTFIITTAGTNPYTNYYSLDKMFGVDHLAGDKLKVTIQQEVAGGPTACTGSYRAKSC